MKRALLFALCLAPGLVFADASAKDLVGSWKIDAKALTAQAEAAQKAGKKEDAMGLAMFASMDLTMTFEKDGVVSMEMVNPFAKDAKKEKKKETAKYTVLSAKGDELTVKSVDAKGKAETATFTITGKSMVMKGEKGPAVAFVKN